jgi:hypothetical protein
MLSSPLQLAPGFHEQACLCPTSCSGLDTAGLVQRLTRRIMASGRKPVSAKQMPGAPGRAHARQKEGDKCKGFFSPLNPEFLVSVTARCV